MASDSFVHPSAVVEDGARIGQGSHVGPFCHVGPDVTIGENVELVSHVAVMGATTIGDGCKVFPTATLGGPPQSYRHKGGRTTLDIGRNCTIREGTTMHVGTDSGRGATTIGDNGNFLAYSHVAHDCIVGDNVTMTNCATLGGHCELGDNVLIGGLTAVHQFVRVGSNAFLAGCSAVVGDVIPYGIAVGNRAKLRGFNIVGMKRAGMMRSDIHRMREAYKVIFDTARPLTENIEIARREFADSTQVMGIVDFMSHRGKRYYTVPSQDGADNGDEPV